MKIPPSTPGLAPKASVHSRFIPREELQHFEAWAPGALSDNAAATPQPGNGGATRAAPGPADPVHAARQAGYEDGYRDGLVALEGFKKSFAANTTQSIGALLNSVGTQLDTLQQAIASAVVQTATQLALQIVRSEISTRPELVVDVAEHALEALMLSARHITLRVHPDDQPLVAQGAADVLAARGARLIADASVQRGGCLIDSDLGRVDASIASRWSRGVASIGSERPWDGTEAQAVANPAGPSANGAAEAAKSPTPTPAPTP